MKSMTNTKAFWICFFAPLIVLGITVGGISLISKLLDVFGHEFSLVFNPLGILFLVVLTNLHYVLLFSSPFIIVLAFIIPPFFLAKKHGKEFRIYGLYGILAAILGALIFASFLE